MDLSDDPCCFDFVSQGMRACLLRGHVHDDALVIQDDCYMSRRAEQAFFS